MTDNEFKDSVIEKLTKLGVQMQSLIGNGRPGRIERAERRIQITERFAWILTGGLVLLSFLVGWGIDIVQGLPKK